MMREGIDEEIPNMEGQNTFTWYMSVPRWSDPAPIIVNLIIEI
jgi:hypothetical protein